MLKQLIYKSVPKGYDPAILAAILVHARRDNSRNGVSGALVCRPEMYLQLIERPADQIDRLYERIKLDVRHANVRLLFSGAVAQRMFPGWAMLDDPTRSWSWWAALAAADADAVSGAASGALHWAFERIAAEVARPVDKRAA